MKQTHERRYNAENWMQWTWNGVNQLMSINKNNHLSKEVGKQYFRVTDK